MKFRALYKWKLSEPLNGLIFFAQRLDELLFDYTLDSYKPAALNASTLCEEALGVISAIAKGHTDPPTLEPVLQELEWSLHSDPVAKSLLDAEIEKYVLKHPEVPLEEKRLKLEVLSRTLNDERYVERCYEHLRTAVIACHKTEIDFLTRTLVTSLVNHGISKSYLYKETQDFFFRGTGPTISGIEALEAFLNNIRPTIHDFDVYFIVSDAIRQIKSSIEPFGIKMLDGIPEDLAEFARAKNFAPKETEVIVQVGGIRSYDCYAARGKSERRIDMLRDLFTLFSHQNQLSWKSEALIKQCCKVAPEIVDLPKNAMQKRVDPNAAFASKRLNLTIGGLALRFGNTFQKFNRIVDLHGIGVTNNVPENQLLNLWICLETLVPGKGAKVTSVIRALESFARRTYVRRLIDSAMRDLMLWDTRRARSVLKRVPNAKGQKMPVRLLFLLALDSNSPLREELYSSTKDFHLLRFRLYKLHEALRSPKSALQLIDAHWRKVEWQLRRIYRTRNALVHDGDTPPYLGALIENGHDYLDMVLDEVLDHSCGPRKIETLDQAFTVETLLFERFRRSLSQIQEFDATNLAALYQAPLYRPKLTPLA